jgi:mRNA interferase RelE/StbE
MTYSLDWEPPAVDLAARYLADDPDDPDDPDGLRGLMTAVDSLAHDPRPGAAFPLGITGMFRLRIGRYRVVYQVDDRSRAVSVMLVDPCHRRSGPQVKLPGQT